MMADSMRIDDMYIYAKFRCLVWRIVEWVIANAILMGAIGLGVDD